MRPLAEWNALLKAVSQPDGALPVETRTSFVDSQSKAGTLGALASKVAHNAGSITDETIAVILAGGQTDDAVFETIVCAAVGAAKLRIDAGLAALAESP